MEDREELPRQIGRALFAFVASILFTLLTASPASASSPPPKPSVGATSLCSTSNITGQAQSAASNYLPANRWLGALGTTHTDLALGFNIGNDIAYAQRSGLISPLMSVGNAEWGLGISATEFANNFCISSTVGNKINAASADFDKALQQGDIVVIIIVIALLALLIKHSRGQTQGLMSSVVRIAMVVAVFSIMLSASANQQPNAPPKFGSPSWILNTVYGAVSSITAAPTQAMSKAVSGIGSNGGGQALSDPLNCYYYNQVLVDTYSGSSGGISAAKGGSNGVGSSYAAVPVALNTLWEGLAVPTYVEEQFGANNNFGTLTYCHLLEQNAGIRPRYQAQIQSAAIAIKFPSLAGTYNTSGGNVVGGILGSTAATGSSASALSWNGAISPQTQDESMVGWAACQTNSTTDKPTEWDVQGGGILPTSEWSVVKNTVTPGGAAAVQPQDCQAFFETPVHANGGTAYGVGTPPPANSDYSVFNWWAATPANIASDTTSSATGNQSALPGGAQFGAGIADYLNNLHGTSNTGAEATALIFVFSSSIIMVVFFGLSMALLIAKFALLFLLLMLPIMLLLMLLPFANSDGKFLMMAKKTLSLIVFSTSVGFVLSFIAGLSAMLSSVGSALAGPGSIFSLIFIGISPLVAIYVIHMFFKKVLKAPSPFKPSGLMGYAASAGTLGAIGGAELGSHWRKARNMASNYAVNKGMPGSTLLRGGHHRREGGMSNKGAGGGSKEMPNIRGGDIDHSAKPGEATSGGVSTGYTTSDTPSSPPHTSGVSDKPTTPKGRAGGAAGDFAAAARAAGAAAAAAGSVAGSGSVGAMGVAGSVAGSGSVGAAAGVTPKGPRTVRQTARGAANRLARGAKYVAPHPLEGMKGKSVGGKVAHVAKKSAKYAAVGSVALAATPAMAGVATLGALAAGAVGAAAVSRKMHLRSHPELQRSRNETSGDGPTGSTLDPTDSTAGSPVGDIGGDAASPIEPDDSTDTNYQMPHKEHDGRETKFVPLGNMAREVYVDDGTPVERIPHWQPPVGSSSPVKTTTTRPTRTLFVKERGQTTERTVSVDETETARPRVREPYKSRVRDLPNPSIWDE